MTTKALDYDQGSPDDEIDVIVKSIPFLVNSDEVMVEEIGMNGIGGFNFFYRVQKSDSIQCTGVHAMQMFQLTIGLSSQ